MPAETQVHSMGLLNSWEFHPFIYFFLILLSYPYRLRVDQQVHYLSRYPNGKYDAVFLFEGIFQTLLEILLESPCPDTPYTLQKV